MVEGPYDLLKLRSRPMLEFDLCDFRAVDNKKVEFCELIFV